MIRSRPWTHDSPQLLLQRLALAILVVAGLSTLRTFSAQPFPAGIARYVDFSFLAVDAVGWLLNAGLLVALVLYVLGRAMVPAVAYVVFLWVAAGALHNSQGALAHHTQLVAMVLMGQLIAYMQAAFGRRARVSSRSEPPGAHELAADYSRQVIAAGYLLAAIAKLVRSDGRWIAQVPLIAGEVLKTHGQTYASTLTDGVIARGDAIARFIFAHPDVIRGVLGCALLLELTAPLALLGRTPALIVGVGLLAMHAAIGQIMLVYFPENVGLLLIYFVDAPFLLVLAWRRWRPSPPIEIARAA
jgi:hypothetical protein